MKIPIFILMLICQITFGQAAFYNNGNIQIHNGGEIGFHTNVVNNGIFDQNLGFTGFYSLNNALTISGTNRTVFNDIEIDVLDNLILETSMGVTNNLSFITGNIVTPRENLNITLDFLDYFVYSGEGDNTYVDGYVSTSNNREFTFPVGDEDYLRPMMLPEQLDNSLFTGAYFKEDPNSPSTFNTSFNTAKKQDLLVNISEVEFWDLNGASATEVVLSWDFNSDIESIATNIKNLHVVGWENESNKWVDLGGKNSLGDLISGSVQSESFIPNNYEIITIGSDFIEVNEGDFNIDIDAFTPNGDGINDLLVFEGIELHPNNILTIINRWGATVYTKKGYDNTWDGISDYNLTINRSKGLPVGTYFYYLTLLDEEVNFTGYIYLNR